MVGEFVSAIGDWLYLVAVLVVVYQETDSPVVLGVVGAARILPYILLSVPAGIVADRVDRRLLLLITDVVRGVLMLLLALLVATDGPVIAIVALTILAASVSTFFGPAIAAFLPTVVTDESELGPANTAWSSLDNLAFVMGPAVAGLLIAAGGLTLAFVLNAASFGFVAVVLARLPSPPQATAAGPKAPIASSASMGSTALVESRRSPTHHADWAKLLAPLSAPVLLDATTSFFGGGLGVLTVVLATEVLGSGEAGTGYLNAAIGVGGILGAIGAGALVLRRLTVPLVVGGVLTGLGTLAIGVARDFWLALAVMAVAAGGAIIIEIVTSTLIQRTVPDELRGRVVGVTTSVSALVFASGSLFMPVLAGAFGITPVFVGSGAAILAATGLALILARRALAAEATAPDRASADRLVHNPLFSGLPPARLEAAVRQLRPVPVHTGEVVIREGDRPDRFYVIATGMFRVTQSGDGEDARHLRDMGPDDVFGEIGLLSGLPRTATVTAATDGQLLALDGPSFLELVASGQGLGPRLLDLHRGPSFATRPSSTT